MWQPRWWHWQDWTHRLAHWLDWQTCVLVLRDDRYYHHCVTCGAETFFAVRGPDFLDKIGFTEAPKRDDASQGDRHG
jgi:hypothetical protein